MPGMNGTGPWGKGQPGRGFGPCGHGRGEAWRTGCAERPARQRLRLRQGQSQLPPQDGVYAYSAGELEKRKKSLEEELRWLEDRIKDLGEESENSNPCD